MVNLPEVLQNIDTIEEDCNDVNYKCNKIQCNYIYEAIKSVFKLIFDFLIAIPCKPHAPAGVTCKPKPKSI